MSASSPPHTLPPARRRAALDTLSRDRLAELTERYELDVADRRISHLHIDALIRARRVDFAELLGHLKRDELKAMCRALDLDDSGRQKQAIIDRILGVPDSSSQASPDDRSYTLPEPERTPRAAEGPVPYTSAAARPTPAPPPGTAVTGEVITGAMKFQVDRLWATFWSNGISNPLSVIEQVSYLLFIKRLDDLELLEERRAHRLGRALPSPRFGSHQQHLRWSHFMNMGDAEEVLRLVRDEVFPFIKALGGSGDQSAYARHMKDAVFLISNAALLENVIRQIHELPLDNRDTKGDLYEYMLSKLTTAGTNGQFRTPRHIIEMMVTLIDPGPDDTICDPACGTTYRGARLAI